MEFDKIEDISSLKWGPRYWFVLHCIAYNYPINPNVVTKRKYYDFIQNIPLFLRDSEMGDKFGVLLDKYPISPYLDSRESFMRWMHFIHNKINKELGKKEITIYESLDLYHKEVSKTVITDNLFSIIDNNTKRQLLIASLIFVCLCFIFIWI